MAHHNERRRTDSGLAQRGGRTADLVADQLTQRVVDMGWPVGAVLGSETDLSKEFAVSRTIVREAARLLEYQSVAYMRRGPGGGLVVAEPLPSTVARALTTRMVFEHSTPSQLLDVRSILELQAVRLAAESSVTERPADLDAHFASQDRLIPLGVGEDLDTFHVLVAAMSGNPVVALLTRCLIEALAQLDPSPSPEIKDPQQSQDEHSAIANAIIAGRSKQAVTLMAAHLDRLAAVHL